MVLSSFNASRFRKKSAAAAADDGGGVENSSKQKKQKRRKVLKVDGIADEFCHLVGTGGGDALERMSAVVRGTFDETYRVVDVDVNRTSRYNSNSGGNNSNADGDGNDIGSSLNNIVDGEKGKSNGAGATKNIKSKRNSGASAMGGANKKKQAVSAKTSVAAAKTKRKTI